MLHLADRGGDKTLVHDLNFLKNRYEVVHTVEFPANRPGLVQELEKSGSVAETSSDSKRKLEGASSGSAGAGEGKVKRAKKVLEKGGVDLERLADGLHRLPEEDLLGVVQMVTDNRTSEMYVKNDVDEGEFHIDLYTLPDSLLRSLLNYVKKRVEV